MKKLRYWCALFAVIAGIAGASATSFADDNFPLYRGFVGGANAGLDSGDDYAYDFFNGPGAGAVATATALIIPDFDTTVTLAQTTSSAAGIGDHQANGATTQSSFVIMANTQSDPYGAMEGIIVTYADGTGTATAWLWVDTNTFIVAEGPGGVVVTFNGTPISITAGDGAPLELVLPAVPGMGLTFATWTQVPAGNNGDQADASVEASVYPVESLPLPSAVFRDYEGNIEQSWEFVPPPRDG